MPAHRLFRVVSLVIFGLFVLVGLVGPSLARAQAPHVLVVTIDGTINQVKERFISRAIDRVGP